MAGVDDALPAADVAAARCAEDGGASEPRPPAPPLARGRGAVAEGVTRLGAETECGGAAAADTGGRGSGRVAGVWAGGDMSELAAGVAAGVGGIWSPAPPRMVTAGAAGVGGIGAGWLAVIAAAGVCGGAW